MTHDDLIARLRELHKAATPGNLSTSEIIEDGEFICPHCDGTGEVAGEQYINYDGVAANVLFSGIGHEFVANRDWYIAISRDWPEIDDALTAAQAENQRLREALRPFGDAAGHALGCIGKTTTLGVLGAIAPYFVTWQDFNRARAALHSTEDSHDD